MIRNTKRHTNNAIKRYKTDAPPEWAINFSCNYLYGNTRNPASETLCLANDYSTYKSVFVVFATEKAIYLNFVGKSL